MIKKVFWILLLILLIVVTSFFLIRAARSLHTYSKLSAQVQVDLEGLKVVKLGEDRYRLEGNYTFEYAEQTYKGKAFLPKGFLNPWAAEEGLKRMANRPLTLYFNPKNPSSVALARNFPYKALISAVVLFGLMIYFVILSFFVRSRGNH